MSCSECPLRSAHRPDILRSFDPAAASFTSEAVSLRTGLSPMAMHEALRVVSRLDPALNEARSKVESLAHAG